MNIVDRVKGILFSPSQEWEKIKGEEHSIAQLYTSYAVILAAIPAIAQFIGYSLVGVSGFGMHIRWSVGNALGHSIVSYVLSLVGVYIVAFIINALAPSFSSQKDITNAVKLSLYSMTPVWIAGILYI
ncbi:Yip1 family protein [Thermodesulfovibrio hydrogeniphilus]